MVKQILVAALVWLISSATTVKSFHDDNYGAVYPFPSYPSGYGYGPPFSCIFNPESQLGLFQCLTPGTAICRDGWAFGIDGQDGYVKLWSPHGKVLYVDLNYPDAKKFCIGEKSGAYMHDFYSHPWYDVKTPFLFVSFDGGDSSAYLRCTGVGREDKDALLKIVDYSDSFATGSDPIVKFKKGPGYENALYWIDAFGRPYADYGCDWFLDKAETPAPAPTHALSKSPSSEPTATSSESPSAALSNPPSMTPSSSPSAALSNSPSMIPSSSPRWNLVSYAAADLATLTVSMVLSPSLEVPAKMLALAVVVLFLKRVQVSLGEYTAMGVVSVSLPAGMQTLAKSEVLVAALIVPVKLPVSAVQLKRGAALV
mmetsp:Transcript_36438/g.79342  ORF Transcript_36438/g.79342 Transcript_36438/m.79342 type:complete len:369 (+) Transcript_36438:52-1158(+)